MHKTKHELACKYAVIKAGEKKTLKLALLSNCPVYWWHRNLAILQEQITRITGHRVNTEWLRKYLANLISHLWSKAQDVRKWKNNPGNSTSAAMAVVQHNCCKDSTNKMTSGLAVYDIVQLFSDIQQAEAPAAERMFINNHILLVPLAATIYR